ncbi:MAG: hypothetical protein HKN52_09780 [Eudoraea sp.]|nr:hypothetical protein [Eudoraea sp.]
MKLITTFLFLIFSAALYSQLDQLDGEYYLEMGNKETKLIEYTLTLHKNGTFYFHSYEHQIKGIPSKIHTYGKGRWSLKDKVVSFFTNKGQDFDERYTLDFYKTKARFITKHPRDKSGRIIKTRLKFFESEIFWIKGIELFKK